MFKPFSSDIWQIVWFYCPMYALIEFIYFLIRHRAVCNCETKTAHLLYVTQCSPIDNIQRERSRCRIDVRIEPRHRNRPWIWSFILISFNCMFSGVPSRLFVNDPGTPVRKEMWETLLNSCRWSNAMEFDVGCLWHYRRFAGWILVSAGLVCGLPVVGFC